MKRRMSVCAPGQFRGVYIQLREMGKTKRNQIKLIQLMKFNAFGPLKKKKQCLKASLSGPQAFAAAAACMQCMYT